MHRDTTPPAGSVDVGEWVDGERPFRLSPRSVEYVSAAVDGFQSRDGFTTSLVAVNVDGQVMIAGQPFSIGTFLWPAQARELAAVLIDLADQCEALDAVIPRVQD